MSNLEQPQIQPSTSSFEDLNRLLSTASRDDLIHVIQELMHVKESELDLPFKTDVNNEELALMPIAWSYYVDVCDLELIKKHLQFRLKLNTSKDGKRAGLIVEALANKATMIQRQEGIKR